MAPADLSAPGYEALQVRCSQPLEARVVHTADGFDHKSSRHDTHPACPAGFSARRDSTIRSVGTTLPMCGENIPGGDGIDTAPTWRGDTILGSGRTGCQLDRRCDAPHRAEAVHLSSIRTMPVVQPVHEGQHDADCASARRWRPVQAPSQPRREAPPELPRNKFVIIGKDLSRAVLAQQHPGDFHAVAQRGHPIPSAFRQWPRSGPLRQNMTGTDPILSKNGPCTKQGPVQQGGCALTPAPRVSLRQVCRPE